MEAEGKRNKTYLLWDGEAAEEPEHLAQRLRMFMETSKEALTHKITLPRNQSLL